ncbi:MAG: alginate lyase family protein [Gemmatimonadaceae bacterium]|nr:alginate lyase family protein [Gemmatimonadaceae bacterium]
MTSRWHALAVAAAIAALSCAPAGLVAQQPGVRSGGAARPRILLSRADGAAIRQQAATAPVMARSLAEAKAVVSAAMVAPIETPPPGEAGSASHEKHKQNYREMQLAGMLYTITGDVRYATWVGRVLDAYAGMYPALGPHPLSKNQAPGKLFHQSLNEANWLVAVAIAYDCVYEALPSAQRARIETNVLRNMADWLSVEHAKEFDRIHNHGTWATAAVGMLGLVIDDTTYVNRALYGTKFDKKGGFLRQLDELFSPDGYYMEGPYYIRYALLPFYQFAEALERVRPRERVYAYRDSILKKGLYSAVQTAFPNGVLPPVNDASRTMAVNAPEIVLAVDLAYARYGADRNLLGVAAQQGEVILSAAGMRVARDLAASRTTPAVSWGSVEFTDGADGQRGGTGILRAGAGEGASMLFMKYGVHGEGHGHFDKLHFSFFENGREVIPDYGFSRWINIEPKFGGRYLPENDSYAMQTIAHNTVVVDGRTQNGGVERAAEAMSGKRHFFEAGDANVQAMSARADGYSPGVNMQRTMLLLRDRRLPYPVVVDLVRVTSETARQYDWPVHFRGQMIASNVPYTSASTAQAPLGEGFGYQHLWKEASGTTDSTVKVTWLDGGRFYSVIAAGAPNTELVFARTGASDPNFNLIVEPMVVLRRRATDHVFAAVVEPHGFFNEAQERSVEARPRISGVRVLASDAAGSVVEVTGEGGLRWVVHVNNGTASRSATHVVRSGATSFTFTGNVSVTGLEPPR